MLIGGLKLSYKKLEDWFNINSHDIIKNGGKRLLILHNESPSKLVLSIYPSLSAQSWRFKVTPRGYWDESSNVKEFLEHLKKKYKLIQDIDWNKVSLLSILRSGGSGLLRTYGTFTFNMY